jgi:hypothetical protein
MAQLNEVQCAFVLGFSCGSRFAMAELRAKNDDLLTKMKDEVRAELQITRDRCTSQACTTGRDRKRHQRGARATPQRLAPPDYFRSPRI